jgi:hypothetical protein
VRCRKLVRRPRSGAGARIATDAHADLAALIMLATLLRQSLNDHLASSNAPLSGASRRSRDQNRGEVYATPDEADAGAPRRLRKLVQ